jgi:DNA polymerase (family 10)
MTNKDIAGKIKLMADLMELHDENAFRIKSYANAYLSIRKFPKNLTESSESDIADFPGLGKSVTQKVLELIKTGTMADLDVLLEKTPAGVTDMLRVKGLGPKKVKALWKGELAIEDTAELYQACMENRLIKLPGFGTKTQEDVKDKLQFHFSNQGKYHLATVYDLANELIANLRSAHKDNIFELSGDIRRKMPIINGIDVLSTLDAKEIANGILNLSDTDGQYLYKEIPVFYKTVDPTLLYYTWVTDSSSPEFSGAMDWPVRSYVAEEDVFKAVGASNLAPEFRESEATARALRQGKTFNLIEETHIKGLIHNHSTYSDGVNTLKEMADTAQKKGYEYLVISDHSISAFYANGLKVDDVYRQWEEIEHLNKQYNGFKIIKGIEADILNDGRLDYDNEILSGFEIVIASIHSNLRMDQEKATSRLIKAIENPFTHILGHPTGRLLLGRKGYDVDYEKIFDACAANRVAIELNCNPLRMDLDWTQIPKALEKGIKICINPDAHSIAQYDFVRFGIFTGRKAGLSPSECLNYLSCLDLLEWADMKK